MKCLIAVVYFLLLFRGTIGDPLHKKLAGPPSEFSSFVLPTPEKTSVFTKGTFVPITFSGKIALAELIVDSKTQYSFCVLSPNADSYTYEFALPDGQQLSLQQLVAKFNGKQYQDEIGVGTAALYAASCVDLFNPITGEWQVTISSTSDDIQSMRQKQATNQANGYFVTNNEDSLILKAYSSENRFVGQNVNFIGELIDSATGETVYRSLDESTAYVIEPNGAEVEVKMHDDGLHGDGLPYDGIFGGNLTVAESGFYTYTTYVYDVDHQSGNSFERSVERLFQVIPSTVKLASKANAFQSNRKTLQIDLEIKVNWSEPQLTSPMPSSGEQISLE